MNLGEKLEKLRDQKGETFFQLSKNTGISQSYLNRLATGKNNNPSTEKLEILAQYYNVSMAFFLSDNGEEWLNKLPPELKEFVRKENIEYLEVIYDMKNADLKPDTIKEIIQSLKKAKEQIK